MADCEFCRGRLPGVVIANEHLSVVLVDDANYPGFARVIWNAHVREMTDLSAVERQRLMQTVWAVEKAQRAVLAPHKINLASLGNVTPHLHWHVIPRFVDDVHGSAPIWAAASQPRDEAALQRRGDQLVTLRNAIAEEVSRVGPAGNRV